MVAEVGDCCIFGKGQGAGFAMMGEGKVDGMVGCRFSLRRNDGIFCHTATLQRQYLSNKLQEFKVVQRERSQRKEAISKATAFVICMPRHDDLRKATGRDWAEEAPENRGFVRLIHARHPWSNVLGPAWTTFS